jgi:tetratricopeptide (TPR) repeat protein
MLTKGWKLAPLSSTAGEPAGAWFRANIAWRTGRSEPRATNVCGAPPGTTGDAQLRACTDFLADDKRTAYERAYAYRSRGNVQAQKGEFDLALADFDAGIRASPGIAEMHISRARAHLAKGNKELAFADLDAAVQVEPLSYSIRMSRGAALHDAGQTEQGLADFNYAVRIAPAQSQPGALNDRCFFLARIGRAQEGWRTATSR